MVALEVLRVFEPKVFEMLSGERRCLLRESGPGLYEGIEQTEIENAVTNIVSCASKDGKERTRFLVTALFPSVSAAFAERGGTTDAAAEWLRDARICHADLFDRYFVRSMQSSELAQSDIDRVISATRSRSEFSSIVRSIRARGLERQLFESLESFKNEIPETNLPELTRALIDLCDEFDDTAVGFFDVDLWIFAYRLVYFGLLRCNDVKARGLILKEAFADSSGLLLPVAITSEETRKQDRDAEYLVDVEGWDDLKSLCVKKIYLAAVDGRLRAHVRAGLLFGRWMVWDAPNAKEWARKVVAGDTGVAWLLTLLLTSQTSYATREGYTTYSIKLSDIENVIDVDFVQNAVNRLDESKLTELERAAVTAFRKALIQASLRGLQCESS